MEAAGGGASAAEDEAEEGRPDGLDASHRQKQRSVVLPNGALAADGGGEAAKGKSNRRASIAVGGRRPSILVNGVAKSPGRKRLGIGEAIAAGRAAANLLAKSSARRSAHHDGHGGSAPRNSSRFTNQPLAKVPEPGAAEDSDAEEEEEEEVLEGVPVRKVSEQPQGGGGTELKMSPTAVLLQETKLFKGFSDKVIAQLAAGVEPRLFRPGEMIYREGERQQWLGLLLSGAATVHITALGEAGAGADSFGTARPEISTVREGSMFGELCALRVRETRPATVIADADCQVATLEGKVLWAAVEAAGGEERQRLIFEADRWRAFMHSRFAMACHPEIAYQLRMRSTFRTLLPEDELVFGSSELTSILASEESTHLPTTTAVLETGRVLAVSARREMLPAGSVIGEAAVLGVKGAMVISCPEGECHLACISREVFWKLISRFAREREAFTRLALELLPPSTSEVSYCPLIAHIQGPQAQAGLARTIQGLARQRIVHPGADVCVADEPDALIFFQQGSAEVLINEHKVREVQAGGLYGDLRFLGASTRGDAKVRALELCVLQELHRADFDAQLGRQHTVRARFRELARLKTSFQQDAQAGQQVLQLKRMSFFADCSEEFLADICNVLEERLFVPGQTIIGPSDGSNFMSILLDGTAERRQSGGPARTMQPGETVGEMALLSSSCDAKESVVAVTVCCTQTLHRMLLISCLQKHPQVKRHFEEVAKAYMLSSESDDSKSDSNIYSLPFFKNSGSKFLYLLDIHMERKIFFSDEVIVQEGTTGREMYILYSGTADVTVMDTKVSCIVPGQTFGEMAILGLVQKRTATITATSLCDVRIISAESWERAVKEFPEERARFESLAAAHNRHSLEKQSGGKVRQTSQFFAGCDTGFASAIADLMEDQLFLEGQALMSEGETGDWMALLHQGRAAVSVNGMKVAELKSGDVVGEMAVMGISSARTATVTAMETCFAQVLYRAQLLPVLERFPEERRRIRERAASRMEHRWKGDTVRHLEIFQGCPRVFTDFLDQRTQRWVFFSGDILAKQGATGSHMFVLLTGHVDVEFDGEVVAALHGDSVVGEFVALGISERRTATMVCREICDIYSLSRKDMRAAFTKWPEQNKRLMNLAASRMRKDIEKKNSDKPSLQTCPLFQQCSVKFLECISNHLEDKLFLRSEILCKEGDHGDSMYILLTGTFDCIVGGKKISELNQGSIIGEIAVLGLGTTRTATLRAQSTCLVQQLRGPVLMKYLKEYPREMARFQEVGAARLEQLAVNVESNLLKYQVLFRNCSIEFLDRLTPLLRRMFFFTEQIIIKEGSESSEMYAIGQGRAVVERKGKHVGVIEAGLSLGEMSVLGLAPDTQALTVRAEVLCDTQVLGRNDLEPLLQEFPVERARLLDVAAQMMREDLTQVTNSEILAEVPLLQELDGQLISRLNQVVVVSVTRKGDLIFQPGDTSLFVLLQGTADVEVAGASGRSLAEGDTFGEISILNLAQNGNIGVRASRTCLTLGFSEKDFTASVTKCGTRCRAQLQALEYNLHHAEGMRQIAIHKCPMIQVLALSEKRLAELPKLCEEIVFAAEQEVLSKHLRSEAILFVVAGQVSVGAGEDAVRLDPGASFGELAAEPVRRHHSGGAVATMPCQVLLLHRKAFFAAVDAWPGEERERLHERLQQRRSSHKRGEDSRMTMVGISLRQHVDVLAEQCLNAAKSSLEASNRTVRPKPPKGRVKKMWKMARLSVMIRGTLQDLRNDLKAPSLDTIKDGESNRASRQTLSASVPEASHTRGSHSSWMRSTSDWQKRSTALDERRRAAAKEQEGLLLRDMHRLTDESHRAAEAARREQVQLRREAAELRQKLNAAENASSVGFLSEGEVSVFEGEEPASAPATPRKPRVPAPVPAPRRGDLAGGSGAAAGAAVGMLDVEAAHVAAAERRVERLQAKLAQACRRREDLLRELQQCSSVTCC